MSIASTPLIGPLHRGEGGLFSLKEDFPRLLRIEKSLFRKKGLFWREEEPSLVSFLVYDQSALPMYECTSTLVCVAQYGPLGAPLDVIIFSLTGKVLSRQMWEYDPSGRLKMKSFFGPKGELLGCFLYHFDQSARTLTEQGPQSRRVFMFDEKGRVITTVSSGEGPEQEVHYRYTRTGLLAEETWGSSTGDLWRKSCFVYTVEGWILEERCINAENRVLYHYCWEYEGENGGNWFKRTRFLLTRCGRRVRRSPLSSHHRTIVQFSLPSVSHAGGSGTGSEGVECLTAPSGGLYRGQVHKGFLEGWGVLLFPNGNAYVGQFSRNRMEGVGTLQWSDGTTYTGRLSCGKQEGIGALRWPNGDRFYGIFHNDVRTEKGLFVPSSQE